MSLQTMRTSLPFLLCLAISVSSGDAEETVSAVPADDWTELLNHDEGWIGADGIFTANLDGSLKSGIENRPNQNTAFVFSDTLIGKVDPETRKQRDVRMPNHSFARLAGNRPRADRIEFFYDKDGKTPRLPIKPSKDKQWYWLSECFVLPENDGLKLHAFLLRMEKTDGGGGFGFRHLGVDLLRMDVKDGKFDFDSAKIVEDDTAPPRVAIFKHGNSDSAPETFAYGIGILENIESAGAPDPDGFLYIYGYRDGKSPRQLIVARCRPEKIADFKSWNYYAGDGRWSDKITDSLGQVRDVSTELSVTPIESGPKKGKYALVYTEGTIGPNVALRIGETPYGPFGEKRIIYRDEIAKKLGDGVYAYNAKAHPVLSKTGELVISYNINSMDNSMRIFREADIYRPRFIKIDLNKL